MPQLHCWNDCWDAPDFWILAIICVFLIGGTVRAALTVLGMQRPRWMGKDKRAGRVVVVAGEALGAFPGVWPYVHGYRAPMCKEHPPDPQARDMQELACSPGVRNALLNAPNVDVSVAAHADLLGVLSARFPAGATCVLWLLDDDGKPVNHLVLKPVAPGSDKMLFVRAPGTPLGTQLVLTTETAVGAAPSGPVIAKTKFLASGS